MAEPSMDPINTPVAPALKPKRRFVGASSRPNASRGGKIVPPRRVNQIPDEILNDKALNEAISGASNIFCPLVRFNTETTSPPSALQTCPPITHSRFTRPFTHFGKTRFSVSLCRCQKVS